MAGPQEPDGRAPRHEQGDGAPQGLQLVLASNGGPPAAALDARTPAEQPNGAGCDQSGGSTAAQADSDDDAAEDASRAYKRAKRDWQTECAELEAEQQQLRRHVAALAGSSDPAAQPQALAAHITTLQDRMDALVPAWDQRERQREEAVRKAEEAKAAKARKARLAEQERALAAMAVATARAKEAEAEELARKRREAGLAGEDAAAEATVATCVLGRGSHWSMPCSKAASGCGIAEGERYTFLRCSDGCRMALHHACWRELEKALRETHGQGWRLKAGEPCISDGCPGEICHAVAQQGPLKRAQEQAVLVAPPEKPAEAAAPAAPAKAGKGKQPREGRPVPTGGRKPGAAPTRAMLRMGAIKAKQEQPADSNVNGNGADAAASAADGEQQGRRKAPEPRVDVTKLDFQQLKPVGKRTGEPEPPAKAERPRKERKEARPPPVIGGQRAAPAERLPDDDLAEPQYGPEGPALPPAAHEREWRLEPDETFLAPEAAAAPRAAGAWNLAPEPAVAETQAAAPRAALRQAAAEPAQRAAAAPPAEGTGVFLPPRQRPAPSRPAPSGRELRQREPSPPPARQPEPEQPEPEEQPEPKEQPELEQAAASEAAAAEGGWDADEDAGLDAGQFLTGDTEPGEVGGGPMIVVENIDVRGLRAAGIRPGEHLLDLATAFGTVTEFRFAAGIRLACVRYERADRAAAAVGALHGAHLGGSGHELITARSLPLTESDALPEVGPAFWDLSVADVCTADSVGSYWAAGAAQPAGPADNEGLPPLLAALQACEVVVCDEAGLAAYLDEGASFGVLRSQLAGGGACGPPTGVALLQEETGQLWGLWRLVGPLGQLAVAKLISRFPPLSTADSAQLLRGAGEQHPVSLSQPRTRQFVHALLAAAEDVLSPEAAIDAVNAAVSQAEEDERLARQLQHELDFEAAAGMQGMAGQRPSYSSVTAQAPAAAMALAATQQQLEAAAVEELFWGMPGNYAPPAQQPPEQQQQPEAAADSHSWQQQPQAAADTHSWAHLQPDVAAEGHPWQQQQQQQPEAAADASWAHLQPEAAAESRSWQQQQPPPPYQQQPAAQQSAGYAAPVQPGLPLYHQQPQQQQQQQQPAAYQQQGAAPAAAAAGPSQAPDEAWREAFAAARAAAAPPQPPPAAESHDEFLQDLLSLVLNS